MVKTFLLLIAAVLLLIPLNEFLGSAWLSSVLEIVPLVVLSFWLWTRRHNSEPLSPPPGLWALLAVVLWGLFQLVPLPPALVKFLAPDTWQTYQQSVGAVVSSPWIALSLYPKGTLQTVLTLCSGIACYYLAAQLLQDRLRLKQAALWLTGISGGVAVTMVVLHFLKVFFYVKADAGEQYAIFLQENLLSLGLLQLMLGPLALGAMLATRPSSRYGNIRDRLSTYWQATIQDHFLIIALSALMVPFSLALLDWHFALLYSLALALLWVLLFLKKRGRRETPYLISALVLLGIGLVVGLYNGSVPDDSATAMTRPGGSTVARQLLDRYSVTGAGFGTYEKLYNRYDRTAAGQDYSPLTNSFIMRARTEAGWPFVAIAVCFLGVLLWRAWPAWRKRRNKLAIYLFAGSLCGFVLFITAIVLFGLALPGWLGYYAFIMAGLVVAASRSSYRSSVLDEYLPTNYDRRLAISAMIGAGVVLVAILFHGGGLLANDLFASLQGNDGRGGGNDAHERRLLIHAIRYDPLEATYRSNLAWRLIQQGQSQRAMSYFASSLRLDPLAGLEAYRLGMHLANAGHRGPAYKLMLHGLYSEWNNQALQDDFVSRLIADGDNAKALNHMRQILDANPSKTFEWLHFLHDHGFDLSIGASVLARHPRCYVDYGDFVLEKGYPELAAGSYAEALRILQVTDYFQSELVWRMVAFFEDRQDYEKALATMVVGMQFYPDDLEMLKASGRLHERLGLTFKAAEIYQKVLMHTPQDRELRQHLKQLENQLH